MCPAITCDGISRSIPGVEIAKLIGLSQPAGVRESAGQFHIGHAVALCASGDIEGAKAAVKALSIVWPEGRVLARRLRW